MFSMGLGGVLLMASSNTVIQSVVDNQMRGRVMALFTMSFTGTAPLSNLAMGWIAQRIGGATVLAFTGSICVLSVWLFHRRLPSIRAAVRQIARNGAARSSRRSRPPGRCPAKAGSTLPVSAPDPLQLLPARVKPRDLGLRALDLARPSPAHPASA